MQTLDYATICLGFVAVIMCGSIVFIGYRIARKNSELSANLEAAKIQIFEARGRADAAEQRAQEAQVGYEQLRELLERLRMALTIAPAEQQDVSTQVPTTSAGSARLLSAEQRIRMISYLKGYSNQLSVTMGVLVEPEAFSYGTQIADALRAGGVRVSVSRVQSFAIANAPEEFLYGIRFILNCPEPIRKALECAGLQAHSSWVTPDGAELYIGLKTIEP
ncbi:hypothetical protein MKK58_02825 [Methylobacterium sp. J-078]|uniref:hypothetical protein n=1 Tax=Methylobacterium sp. J-078 TaxID=2836657 RepID=UPI001FB9C7B1|nr:hypothetical protein [Methylobacterium sp. J-078]MCJ2043483.1 hypothetical protein [Methylobacterium sp. J-078]